MIAGVGRATLNAFYTEGLRVDDGNLTFNIVGAKKDIQGNRKDFGTNYGPDTAFDLPPGDYVALVSMGESAVEMPFTLRSGDAIAVDAVLNAGVLFTKAPGADSIDIFSAKKDIQGNAIQFGYAFGEERNATVPAGDYLVVAKMKDGTSKEMAASVTAGERTEIAIE
jgi:Ca-activated chloride channel homolog